MRPKPANSNNYNISKRNERSVALVTVPAGARNHLRDLGQGLPAV